MPEKRAGDRTPADRAPSDAIFSMLTERDALVYRKTGYGKSTPIGGRPALMVVDMLTPFVGEREESILQSVERYPLSCGEDGWRAVRRIKEILDVSHSRGIPVIYTVISRDGAAPLREKHPVNDDKTKARLGADSIVPDIAPRGDDIIVEKSKASAFFGTALVSHLVSRGIDTLVVTGCTTSGCVRATVVDASSYNFRVIVVEECTFDRFQSSHIVSLFDMNAKYANVVSLSSARDYLLSLPGSG